MDFFTMLREGPIPSFEMTPEEQAELTALAARIEKLKQKRLILIRRYARRRGLIAKNPAQLRDFQNNPFMEFPNLTPYRTACSKCRDLAYACTHGCGWVKGRPREQSYNNIGILSGSAGREYLCHICGGNLGHLAFVMS